MLSQVEIRKFRSCSSLKLMSLHELLVLIGRNGAGKTNILKAIEWACRFASIGLEKSTQQNKRILEDGDVALTFTIDKISYRYEIAKKTITSKDYLTSRIEIEEKIYLCESGKSNLVVHREGEHVKLFDTDKEETTSIEISESIPCLLAIITLFPEDNYFKNLATKALKFLSSVKYYPLHNFDEIAEEVYVSGKNYRKWKSEAIKESNSITSVLYKIITLHTERPEVFAELNSLIGPQGLGLVGNIDVQEHDFGKAGGADETLVSNTFFFIYFEQPEFDGRKTFSINDISFGTKRILFLLVSMLYDEASVSLVEQPEDGVHIGLVDKMLPLFRAYSKNSQFVIATHSTTILNKTTPGEIYFISNSKGHTEARTLTAVELSAADKFLREEGPLAEFLEMIGDD